MVSCWVLDGAGVVVVAGGGAEVVVGVVGEGDGVGVELSLGGAEEADDVETSVDEGAGVADGVVDVLLS